VIGTVFKWIGAVVASIVLAALLLAYRIDRGLETRLIANGDWRTSLDTGSEDADVFLRATIAIGGLLASSREDSIYYRLSSVSGQPLRIDCTYRIRGGDYDANWWSITAYGWDHYLMENTPGRYAFNNENLARAADGSWQVVVSRAGRPGNWLPVNPAQGARRSGPGAADFDLLMRLYTPGAAYLTSPATAPLPEVSLVSCS
jgi:hypothetical protein